MAVDRAIVRGLDDGPAPGTFYVTAYYQDGSTIVEVNSQSFSLPTNATRDTVIVAAKSVINTYATSQGYTLSAGTIWTPHTDAEINALIAAAIPSAPTSYQTIVSQAGTAAPAVSGGFTPTSTYAGGTTFTWARTGVGVYTLTASSAVFSTSKTGVFVAPLQNLNGSVRAIVTSSTVITVTTAVQSLAVLGLLGFTATPTDVLLSGTMIYVQTYP